MDVLATTLWAGAAAGFVCVVAGVLHPSRRRAALLLAAALFAPIGVLGILSIGVFFLAAAALCVVGAILSRPSTPRATDPPS